MSLKIGTAKVGNNSTTLGGRNWHPFIESNVDNVYRIIPPIHSLADSGKYYHFVKYHRGFKNSNGTTCQFACTERDDFKTKIIVQRCPVCDMVTELKAKRDAASDAGASKEDLDRFNKENIWPFEVKKTYFLNAIDQSGKVGILQLPSKLFRSLESLIQQELAKGRDILGMTGAYVNLIKQSRYKGDNQAAYFASLYKETVTVNGEQFERSKSHELTPEILKQLESDAYDLPTTIRSIPMEQVAALVAAQGAERAALVDRFFGASEKVAPKDNVAANIPGTNAQLVSRPEVSATGIDLVTPTVPASLTNSPAQNALDRQRVATAPETLTKVNTAQPAATTAAPAATQSTGASTVSDEEFKKLFGLN